jgi:hypothetical protein
MLDQNKHTTAEQARKAAKEKNKIKDYTCEFCGVYSANKPKCNKCEEEF